MISAQNLFRLTCCAVLSEIIYQFSRRLFRKYRTHNKISLTHSLKQLYDVDNKCDEFHKVLFFPDPGIVCRRTISGRVCKDKNCASVHEETSLSVLIDIFKKSRKTLDVCVYMITCSVLGNALIECHKSGIAVRIITEERNSGEEGEVIGSQIGKLRASGINVRCHSSSFWMHHKFLIADDEVLVNGSFNWTNQAVMGNFENLIITSESTLVSPFVLEFQRLWNLLQPIEVTENGNILSQ